MSNKTIRRTKRYYLNVAYFNTDGLLLQKKEIISFLRIHNVDVMLLQETLLKPSNDNPKISNYNIVRHDRLTGPRGGTLIYYRKCLRCVPLENPQLNNMEVSACEVTMYGHQPLVLVSAYLPHWKDLLKSDIKKLLELGPSVMLAGNLNSMHISWNPSGNNRNGTTLHKFADKFKFDVIAPSLPTKYPKTGTQEPSIIDVTLVKNVSLKVESIEAINDLLSDHCPVLVKLRQATGSVSLTKPIVTRHYLKNKTTSQEINEILETIELSDIAGRATDSSTTDLVSPGGTGTVLVVDHQFEPLPDDIRQLLRDKNAAMRLYNKYCTEKNRHNLRYLQRQTKQRIYEYKNNKPDEQHGDLVPSNDETNDGNQNMDSLRNAFSDISSILSSLEHINLKDLSVFVKKLSAAKNDEERLVAFLEHIESAIAYQKVLANASRT